MRVSVLGTGYVGLVAGACFSDSGNHVTCLDVNADKIARLRDGIIPIYEPGLEEIVVRNIKASRLMFTTDAASAITQAEVIFVAVGTPQGHDGSSDLSYLMEAVQTIKAHVRQKTLVVLKSTVPVGTSDKVRAALVGSKAPISIVSNPEFLKEGTAVNDFLKPERVIVGCADDDSRRIMADLYAPYIRSGNPILFMDNRSAELSKYAANAFLAMKISFINDLALLAERVGAHIHEVRRAIITDSRIGNQFLYPGCGYGGSCFPKDVLALVQVGKEHGLDLEIFSAVHAVNERQKRILFQKIQKHFKEGLSGKTIAIWGLSFKPLTDDMREAPSVTLIQALNAAGCRVQAYDPVAMTEARRIFPNEIQLYENAYDAIEGADALAILTEWNEFRSPDFSSLKEELSHPVIFDGRNLFNPASLEARGFTYYCIGKPDPL